MEKYPYYRYYYPSDFEKDALRFERDADRFEELLQTYRFKENHDTIEECSSILHSILARVARRDWDLKSLSRIHDRIHLIKSPYNSSFKDLQRTIDDCIGSNESRLEFMQSLAKKQYDDAEEFDKAIDFLWKKLEGGRAGGDLDHLRLVQRYMARTESKLREVLHNYVSNEFPPYHHGVIYKTLKPVGEQLKEKDALLNIYKTIQDKLLKASLEVKNKEDLDAFLAFYEELDCFPISELNTEKFIKHKRNILGISEKDSDLRNFDLKNSEDIKHCKQLYPLAIKYPDLFRGWYDSDDIIQFEPTYENGLEKKRKELNAKLTEKSKSTKGFKRGIIKVATKIVPEKVSKKTAKMEQKIADVIYRKKQKGRK